MSSQSFIDSDDFDLYGGRDDVWSNYYKVSHHQILTGRLGGCLAVHLKMTFYLLTKVNKLKKKCLGIEKGLLKQLFV